MQYNKFVIYILPYVIFLSTIANFFLVGIGISYSYIFFIILSITFFAFHGLRFKKIDFLYFLFFFLYFSYIILQLFLIAEDKGNVIIGAGAYILFPIYWFFANRFRYVFDFEKFIFQIMPIVIFISFLGIIQYHFSPDLYGWLKNSNSNNILWASEASSLEYLLFFRATSILSSPQVFGLFLALFIFLIHNNKHFSKSKQNLYILICFVGAVHSGNKMVYLLFFLFLIKFFFFKFRESKINALISFLFLLIIIGICVFILSSYFDFGIFNRIISLDQILEEESEGRFSIYLNMLKKNNWILGEGPGVFSTSRASEKSNYKVAESYFLQFLLENGILFFSIFIGFCFFLLAQEFIGKRWDSFYFLTAFFCSMIFVHAHTDPVFYIFWGATFKISLNNYLLNKEITEV